MVKVVQLLVDVQAQPGDYELYQGQAHAVVHTDPFAEEHNADGYQ